MKWKRSEEFKENWLKWFGCVERMSDDGLEKKRTRKKWVRIKGDE